MFSYVIILYFADIQLYFRGHILAVAMAHSGLVISIVLVTNLIYHYVQTVDGVPKAVDMAKMLASIAVIVFRSFIDMTY